MYEFNINKKENMEIAALYNLLMQQRHQNQTFKRELEQQMIDRFLRQYGEGQ